MAMNFQNRGIFGTGITGSMGILPGDQPMTYPVPVPPQQKKKSGGFFGEGGAGRGIAGTIGDYLLQLNGMRPMYAPAMQQQRALDAAQQQRQQGWEDFVRQYEYKRANPMPTNNDTAADYEFWKSKMTPEQFSQWVANKANPPVWRQGADGQFYRVDTPQASSTPPDTLPSGFDFGGGTGNGVGGF